MDNHELLTNYTEYLRTCKFANLTRQHYLNWVGAFLRTNTLTLDNVENYLNDIKANKSSSTFNAKLSALKHFCQWAFSIGLISWNYTSGFGTIKVQNKIIEPFTRQEQNKLKPLFSLPCEQVLWIWLSNGLRKNEARQVAVPDIMMGDRHSLITIRNAKGGRERTIPITNEHNETLWRLYKEGHLEKCLPLSNRWASSSSLNSWLKAKGVQAGIKGVCNPHKFRRTYANLLIKQNMPIEHIQRLLGHASVLTTMGYVNTKDREIIDKLKRVDLG